MTIFYFLILALELVGEYVATITDNYTMVYIVKPLLMPILAVMLLKRSTKPLNLFVKMVLAALFFSWLGDLLLMLTWSGPDLFVFGLAAFLVAHVFYIIAFRPQSQGLQFGYLIRKPLAGFILLIYVAGLIYMLFNSGHPDFGAMSIPVVIYALVILTMTWSALDRRGRVSDASFNWIFWGAVIFMLSDSMIAVNKFTTLFADLSLFVRVAIMFTYGLAQFMIVRGTIIHFENKA